MHRLCIAFRDLSARENMFCIIHVSLNWSEVVKGGDSQSEGCEFDSWCRILDGDFFTIICCKICIVCLKETINKRITGLGWPIFLKKSFSELCMWGRTFDLQHLYEVGNCITLGLVG